MGVVADVESTAGLAGRVERQARQLPRLTDKLVTLPALRQMVINIAKGISGIQYGSRPAPLSDTEVKALGPVAVEIVGRYFATFTAQIRDREHYLAGTAPVLAAVGAMGNDVLTRAYPQVALKDMFTSLKHVDWTRVGRWRGIAGDFTSKGVFSVKGTKEVSYAVYNALTDDATPGYTRIRLRADHTVQPVDTGTRRAG